jgi:hypothetical protein
MQIRLLSLNFLACGKEEVKEYSKYPIDFKVEQLPNGVHKYVWTGIKTSDFKEYWVVRNSGKEVPYINENNPDLLLNDGASIIAKITDANQTEFVDSTSIFSDQTFVRVFAFLENRALSSLNKEIKGFANIFEIKGNLERVIFDKKNNAAYIFDIINRQILNVNLFDYKIKNTIFRSLDNTREMYLDESVSPAQLYFPEFQSTYTVMDVPSFNQRLFINFPFFTRSVAICRDRFLVFSNSQFIFSKNKTDLSFQTINQLVLTNIKTTQLPILRWLKSRNQVLALNSLDTLSVLNSGGIDQNGFLGGNFKSLFLKSSLLNDINKPFVITPLDLFILIDNQGVIIETETLKPVSSLAEKAKLTSVKYRDFCFSTDEKFVYALREGNIRSEKKIDVFNYPTFDFVKSISYVSNPKKMIYHDNKLKLVGESPNNAQFTMFEAINP